MRNFLVAGNWKMHGDDAGNRDLVAGILEGAPASDTVSLLVCPPYPYLGSVASQLAGSSVQLGAQNVSEHEKGAFTGEVAPAMLREVGCRYVIVGHSERRTLYGESSAQVAEKMAAALAAGLVPILCVGETLEEREAGRTIDIVGRQLAGSVPDATTSANTVVAYEPVWAIGTGKVPTRDEIGAVHDDIRARLTERFGDDAGDIRILYGGSVKPSNAAEIFAVSNVDGALVGGASLKASDFGGIISALETA